MDRRRSGLVHRAGSVDQHHKPLEQAHYRAFDALRAHMLQGAGLAQVAPQLGILLAWLLVCFTLALRLFRWR